jgi:hypothetical protein
MGTAAPRPVIPGVSRPDPSQQRNCGGQSRSHVVRPRPDMAYRLATGMPPKLGNTMVYGYNADMEIVAKSYVVLSNEYNNLAG